MVMKNAHEVYTQFLPPKEVLERKSWCRENVGRRYDMGTPEGVWDLTWMGPQKDYGTGYMWKFREEKDAVLFALKWT
jgi:hypothetical protein